MVKKWPKMLFVFLLGLMVVLSGCNFQSSSDSKGSAKDTGKVEKKSENVLNLSLDNDIPDLNQVKTTDAISFSVLNNVMEGLYRINPKNEPEPAMAKSSEVSKDGLTYTFHLRDNVKWSNGDPVTANDFRYSWLRAMDSKTAGSYSFILSDYIKGGADFAGGKAGADTVGIKVKDDKTLVVQLEKPTPFFITLTAFVTYFPLNEKFVTEKSDQFALTKDNILYNGPYTLTDYNQAEGVTLEKSPQYWDKKNVAVDKVNMKVIKEQSTALNLYEAGNLDKVTLSSADVNSYKDSKEFHTETEFTSYYIQFNLGKDPISNPNIRKALQMAYDPKTLTSVVLNNGSEPAYGLIAPKMTGASGKSFREMQGDVVKPNVKKAKELWDKGVKELGKTPEISLLTADDSVSKDTATFLQSEFKKNLGIDIQLATKPYSGRLQAMRDNDYQMVVSKWGADYNDPMTYLGLWMSPAKPFRGNYANPKYDELVTAAKNEADEKVRMKKLLEAEKVLLKDDAVLGTLYYQGSAYLEKPYVKGIVTHPSGSPLDLKYTSVQ